MQTISDGVFYRFGSRSFASKLFKNLLVPLLGLVVVFVIIYSKDNELWKQLDLVIPVTSHIFMVWILIGLTVITVIVQVIVTFVSYYTTQVMLSTNTLTYKTGFFLRQEENFPLRFITDVSYQQNILDQVFGVATCTIEMMSDEKDAPHADKVTFNDMDYELVAGLENAILARTNIQQVTVAPVATSVQQ